jgi:hypothetical protein
LRAVHFAAAVLRVIGFGAGSAESGTTPFREDVDGHRSGRRDLRTDFV